MENSVKAKTYEEEWGKELADAAKARTQWRPANYKGAPPRRAHVAHALAAHRG